MAKISQLIQSEIRMFHQASKESTKTSATNEVERLERLMKLRGIDAHQVVVCMNSSSATLLYLAVHRGTYTSEFIYHTVRNQLILVVSDEDHWKIPNLMTCLYECLDQEV